MVDPSLAFPSCAQAFQQPFVASVDTNIPQNQLEEISTACSQNIVNSFKAIQLDIGEFYKVKVSHVEDGPAKFSVQLMENIPTLDSMMSNINAKWTPSKPMQHVFWPNIGSMYLAKQTRPKKRLSRVIVNSLSPGAVTCSVYYPDYGKHEKLSVDKIFEIPDMFVSVPICSIEFTLSGITDWKISQKMKKFFQRLILDEYLIIRVCKGPLSPFIQYCDIYLENNLDQVNIKKRLVAAFPDACDLQYNWDRETVFTTFKKASESTYKKKEVLVGSREDVHVTYVDSCSKFFVLFERDFGLLHELSIQIEKISKTASMINVSQLYESMPCIALYNLDNTWHRVSVTDIIDHNKVKVFYVDFGNEEVITIDNLRTIPPEIVSMVPKQALKCRLDLTGDSGENLSARFKNLVTNKRLSIKILKTYPQVTFVQLSDDKNVLSINSNDIANFLLFELGSKLRNSVFDR